MAFTDLPDGWTTVPITHPSLLDDALDLLVSEVSRRTGALYLLFCDEGERLVTPVEISPIADAPTRSAERAALLRPLLAEMGVGGPPVTVLVALARPGGLSVTEDDVAWAQAASAAAAGAVRLLGVHLVTPDGSRTIPWSARAA